METHLSFFLLFIPPRAIVGLLNNFAINPNFTTPKFLLFICEVDLNTGEIKIKSTFKFILFLTSLPLWTDMEIICLFLFLELIH